MITRKNYKDVLVIISIGIGSFLLGSLMTINRRKKVHMGVLRVDQSEPDISERLFLELSRPIEELKNTREVVFRVVNENYISH